MQAAIIDGDPEMTETGEGALMFADLHQWNQRNLSLTWLLDMNAARMSVPPLLFFLSRRIFFLLK